MIGSLHRPGPTRDAGWAAAGERLKDSGRAPSQHVLLQENVATYLAHSSDPEDRWGLKLQRDLKSPYSDGQVLDHVDDLQESLQRNLAAIPSPPRQVFITGSFAKGRLGANSDLDAYVELGPEARTLDLSALQRLSSDTGAAVFPIFSDMADYNRTLFTLTGATVEVSPTELARPGSLRQIYATRLQERGIEVEADGTCHKVAPNPDRRETHPVFEKVVGHFWGEAKSTEEKYSDLNGRSLKARAMRGAFSLAGRLSALPGLGPLLEKTADFFVRQHHH